MKNPTKILMIYTKKVTDLDWRILVLLLPPLTLLIYISVPSVTSPTTFGLVLTSFSSINPLRSIFHYHNDPIDPKAIPPLSSPAERLRWLKARKSELDKSRIAVCLVGGARRFELTGTSIIENVLEFYPNSDLFLHSPLDFNSFKLSLLKDAPRIASVKIFQPQPIPETENQQRVLTAHNSPNGIQGLLQYFNLVEHCLAMINDYQIQNNFTYDWVIRTRVDSYWSEPLGPDNFIPGQYLVPSGSSYGGLNDRLGIGDLNTSIIALSRLSLIPWIDQAGFQQLNSESSFKAQFTTKKIPYALRRFPFCIVTDRKYDFPPSRFGVPVAALSSRGPLSGAKCRPCKPACTGDCVGPVMNGLYKGWSWTEWSDNSLELCDGHGEWEEGWEEIFDKVGGKRMEEGRKRIKGLKLWQCVEDLEEMRNRTAHWIAPPSINICRLGLP